MRGRRIKTVERLRVLANNRRAVQQWRPPLPQVKRKPGAVVDCEFIQEERPLPAVFVLNMAASLVLRKIEFGLYEYRAGAR